MKTVEVKCDRCGCDLTRSGNSIDWRISLRSEQIPSFSGFVTDMMIYPQIESDLHFCSLGHLLEWAEKTSRNLDIEHQKSYYKRSHWTDGFVGSRFERERLGKERA